MIGMFDQGSSASRTVYICTRLSTIAPHRADYFTPRYFDIGSAGLNTGEEKFIFSELSEAEEQLEPRGAVWCIYEVNIPENALTTLPDGKLSVNTNFEFKAEHIQNIHFHRHSPHASSSSQSSSPGM